jgi:CheY-like chemotaxis protein
MGIPQENLDKIFDPYFTTRESGNGLGLTTSYAIVQRHGGNIEVTSAIGSGTTYSIYLPASIEKTTDEQADEKQQTIQGRGRILLMDDEEIIRKSTGNVMVHLGYEIEEAVDGREAVEKYRTAVEQHQPFDAVVLDLSVSVGMGGKDAIRELLAIDPHARVIVSSGYSNDPVMTNYTQYGFCAAISKPYNVEELRSLLQSVIESEESGEEMADQSSMTGDHL